MRDRSHIIDGSHKGNKAAANNNCDNDTDDTLLSTSTLKRLDLKLNKELGVWIHRGLMISRVQIRPPSQLWDLLKKIRHRQGLDMPVTKHAAVTQFKRLEKDVNNTLAKKAFQRLTTMSALTRFNVARSSILRLGAQLQKPARFAPFAGVASSLVASGGDSPVTCSIIMLMSGREWFLFLAWCRCCVAHQIWLIKGKIGAV